MEIFVVLLFTSWTLGEIIGYGVKMLKRRQQILRERELGEFGTKYLWDDPRYGHDAEWCKTYNAAMQALNEGRDPLEDLLKASIAELEPKPKKSTMIQGSFGQLFHNGTTSDARQQIKNDQEQWAQQNYQAMVARQHQQAMQQMDQSLAQAQQMLGQAGLQQLNVPGLSALLGGIFGDTSKH